MGHNNTHTQLWCRDFRARATELHPCRKQTLVSRAPPLWRSSGHILIRDALVGDRAGIFSFETRPLVRALASCGALAAGVVIVGGTLHHARACLCVALALPEC
eukprot:4571123-Pyramimonas_sp.AAC.1